MKNFSLVSYLSGEEYKKVRDLQKKLSEITGSKKCLEDWLPHITIGDGPVVPASDLKVIEKELYDFSQNQKRISASTSGFGGTENWKGAIPNKVSPFVIWLDVTITPEMMELFNELKETITSKYDTWLPRTSNYVSHITLAFADLSEDGYRKGMEYLKSENCNISFSVSSVALVECYGEGNMESVEYKKFYFK